jgi:excisionase family DNA binding protein
METQRALTISEVCARASASRTAVYEAIKAGDLVARKRGRRTLVLAEDVSACPCGGRVRLAQPPPEAARKFPRVSTPRAPRRTGPALYWPKGST